MRIPARAELSLAALAAAVTSCGMNSAADMPDASTGGSAGAPPELALRFDAPPPLMLASRESRVVGVMVDPPGDHWVRFALLGDGSGTPGDASLDATERRTDLTGRAEITLTAPSARATCLLRASVGTIATSLPGGVDAGGRAAVTVVQRHS